MWTFLMLVGFFTVFVGLISVVYPLKALKIKTRKTGALVLLGGFIGVILIGVLIPLPESQPTTSSESTAPAPKEISAKDYLVQAITKVSGSKCNRNIPRVREIRPVEELWFADLNADENFSQNLIKGTILAESTKIFKKVFQERKDIQSLTLQWYYTLQDVRGNQYDKPLVIVTMTSKNAATINWDDFLYDDLPTVADDYRQDSRFLTE